MWSDIYKKYTIEELEQEIIKVQAEFNAICKSYYGSNIIMKWFITNFRKNKDIFETHNLRTTKARLNWLKAEKQKKFDQMCINSVKHNQKRCKI